MPDCQSKRVVLLLLSLLSVQLLSLVRMTDRAEWMGGLLLSVFGGFPFHVINETTCHSLTSVNQTLVFSLKKPSQTCQLNFQPVSVHVNSWQLLEIKVKKHVRARHVRNGSENNKPFIPLMHFTHLFRWINIWLRSNRIDAATSQMSCGMDSCLLEEKKERKLWQTQHTLFKGILMALM